MRKTGRLALVERKEVAQRLFAVWGSQSKGATDTAVQAAKHMVEMGVRNAQFLTEKHSPLSRIASQSQLPPAPRISLQNHTAKSRCATQTAAPDRDQGWDSFPLVKFCIEASFRVRVKK